MSGGTLAESRRRVDTLSSAAKMKGLFKSKPKTPVDIVRQTRDLLIFADRSASEVRTSKREEKVRNFASLMLFFGEY